MFDLKTKVKLNRNVRNIFNLIALLGICVFLIFVFQRVFLLCKTQDSWGTENFLGVKKINLEKNFVVVITSFNNAEFCEKNFLSVADQKYKNFRIIYIDDNSIDDTYEKVKNIIDRIGFNDKVTLIKNSQNLGPVANFYRAIHSCQDNEIVVALNGDDWLAHNHVLLDLNEVYTEDVWATYGGSIDFPTYERSKNSFEFSKRSNDRLRKFVKTHPVNFHLKTFYASLFKNIKLQDFLYKGKFLGSAWNESCMLPILEMAKEHAIFVSDIVYIRNRTNPLNEEKIFPDKRKILKDYVCGLPSYSCLKNLASNDLEEMDVFIVSEDHPVQLYACLESLDSHMKNVKNIAVFYNSSEDSREVYEEVSKKYPKVVFYDFTQSKQNSSLIDFLKRNKANYCAVFTDNIFLKKDLDCKELSNIFHETRAPFLKIINKMEESYEILPNLYFQQDSKELADVIICEEETLKRLIEQSISLKEILTQTFDNPILSFLCVVPKIGKLPNSIIPLQKNKLLQNFKNGLKIDISTSISQEESDKDISFTTR